MLNKKQLNVTNLRLFELIRDTRPTPAIWSKLDSTYWTATLSQLKHNKFELGTVPETGMMFTATFRVEGKRIRAILTPHVNGQRYTHLTVWRWYDLTPKLIGEDKVEVAAESELAKSVIN